VLIRVDFMVPNSKLGMENKNKSECSQARIQETFIEHFKQEFREKL
jgi:hypothetical protein